MLARPGGPFATPRSRSIRTIRGGLGHGAEELLQCRHRYLLWAHREAALEKMLAFLLARRDRPRHPGVERREVHPPGGLFVDGWQPWVVLAGEFDNLSIKEAFAVGCLHIPEFDAADEFVHDVVGLWRADHVRDAGEVVELQAENRRGGDDVPLIEEGEKPINRW